MMLFGWLLMAYGMSTIIVYGSIFNNLRNSIHNAATIPSVFKPIFNFISGLISCMLCTSTWVGFFMSLVLFSPTNEFYSTNSIISCFFDGMLASGGVWAINSIIEWYEQNRPK